MKTLLVISMALCSMAFSATAQQSKKLDEAVVVTAQPLAKVHKLFTRLSIKQHDRHANLQFTVARVQNIRSYRIEAGNDMVNMEQIGMLNQPQNSTTPVHFSYQLQSELKNYKYYRVVQESMAHEIIYSQPVENESSATLVAGN